MTPGWARYEPREQCVVVIVVLTVIVVVADSGVITFRRFKYSGVHEMFENECSCEKQ